MALLQVGDQSPTIYGTGGGVSGAIAPAPPPTGTGPSSTGIVPVLPPPEVLLFPPAPPPIIPPMVNPGTTPGSPSPCSSCAHEYKPLPNVAPVPVLKVQAQEVDAGGKISLASFGGGIPWWLLLILGLGIGYGMKKGKR